MTKNNRKKKETKNWFFYLWKNEQYKQTFSQTNEQKTTYINQVRDKKSYCNRNQENSRDVQILI